MTAEEVVDAIGIPKWGDGVANIRPGLMDRLLVLTGLHVTLDGGRCTRKRCLAPCCNQCVYGLTIKELPRVRVRVEGGSALACAGLDCEAPKCPPWFPKDGTREWTLTGRFVNDPPLVFQMNHNPWLPD
jgi:hypothetical protein